MTQLAPDQRSTEPQMSWVEVVVWLLEGALCHATEVASCKGGTCTEESLLWYLSVCGMGCCLLTAAVVACSLKCGRICD